MLARSGQIVLPKLDEDDTDQSPGGRPSHKKRNSAKNRISKFENDEKVLIIEEKDPI